MIHPLESEEIVSELVIGFTRKMIPPGEQSDHAANESDTQQEPCV
jgi:hypothetical protein